MVISISPWRYLFTWIIRHFKIRCLQTSVLRKKLSLIDANILHVMTQVCECMGSYTSMRAIDQTIVIDQTVQNDFERVEVNH